MERMRYTSSSVTAPATPAGQYHPDSRHQTPAPTASIRQATENMSERNPMPCRFYIPYFFSLLYSVWRVMPSCCETADRLPSCCRITSFISSFSISSRVTVLFFMDVFSESITPLRLPPATAFPERNP